MRRIAASVTGAGTARGDKFEAEVVHYSREHGVGLRFLSLGRYAQPCLSAVQERAPVQTYSLDPTADKALEAAIVAFQECEVEGISADGVVD